MYHIQINPHALTDTTKHGSKTRSQNLKIEFYKKKYNILYVLVKKIYNRRKIYLKCQELIFLRIIFLMTE